MSKPKDQRYTVAVDFDGVIHQYITPWISAHQILDPPIPGSIEWLWKTIQKFDIVIYTTRASTFRGRRAVRAYLKKYTKEDNRWYETMLTRGLEEIKITHRKPPALVYLDDRAIRFEGRYPTAEEIHKAKPWRYTGS